MPHRLRLLTTFFVFGLLLTVSLFARAQTCESLFRSTVDLETHRYGAARLQKMTSRLTQIRQTPTLDAAEALDQLGFGAYYAREQRTYLLDPRHSDLDRFYRFHHEVVHGTTDQLLRTRPSSPETALAIGVFRNGQSIDNILPPEYQQIYQADEMKAYFRMSKLANQIARIRRASDDRRLEAIESEEKDTLARSQAFAAVTLKILAEAELALTQARRGQPLQIAAEMYAPDVPAVFNIFVVLPRSDGAPVVVKIPLYDPTAVDGKIENLYVKLLKVVENGRRIAMTYANSI